MKITDLQPAETPSSGVGFGAAAGGDLAGALPAPTVTGIGGIPIVGTPTDGQTIIYNAVTNTYILGASNADMVPTLIAAADTYTVPANKQALFTMLIDVEGILDVEGYLVEVA